MLRGKACGVNYAGKVLQQSQFGKILCKGKTIYTFHLCLRLWLDLVCVWFHSHADKLWIVFPAVESLLIDN